MTTPTKKAPAPALQQMQKPEFSKMMRELKDQHDAADEAAMSVASAYKKVKKRGINLEAIRLVRRLMTLDNPSKVQAFLADFDRGRELAGFDDQQQLFEEDKTTPQKNADQKVVPIKRVAAAAPEEKVEPKRIGRKKADAVEAQAKDAESHDEKPAVPTKAPISKTPSRKALFDEGDAEVDVITEATKARQAGLSAGGSGQDYDNPYLEKGDLRDAWHEGWVTGSETLLAEARDDKASA